MLRALFVNYVHPRHWRFVAQHVLNPRVFAPRLSRDMYAERDPYLIWKSFHIYHIARESGKVIFRPDSMWLKVKIIDDSRLLVKGACQDPCKLTEREIIKILREHFIA